MPLATTPAPVETPTPVPADATTTDPATATALPWDRGDRPPLTGSWWARGLWLGERIVAAGRPEPDPTLAQRAQRRLTRWREAHPSATPDATRMHLEVLGLTTDQLRDLLAENPAGLAERAQKPAWAGEVERIVAAYARLPHGSGVDSGDWRTGFAAIVEPFVSDALSRLAATAGFQNAVSIVDSSRVFAALRGGLTAQLITMASRVLVLELNVMRVSGQLTGETAPQRFWSFVKRLREPAELAGLLDEYVVLARALAIASGQAADVFAEFLGRYVNDRDLLVDEMFGGTDPGLLVEVQMGGGDLHDGGRSVGLLRFESGARAVYKPRSLAVHRHFNEVLSWYGEKAPELALRQVDVLDRDGYGWTEFVEPAPCQDEAGADRYFFRQGALLALLYGLAGTDFHYENLIAVGDHPVVVDLEALFHVDMPGIAGTELVDRDPAAMALRASVQRVGLLPAVMIGEDGALDVGAMGGDKDVPLPYKLADWDDAGTDEMRLIRGEKNFPGSQNRPSLAGHDLDPGLYLPRLMEGFRAGYQALVTHRHELTGPSGLLARFAADRNRVIVRATRVYATLLNESSHPDVSRDALDRDRIFALLPAMSEHDTGRQVLLGHEFTDMWDGDIPLFWSEVGSPDLWSSRGERIAGAFAVTGLALAEQVLARLGDHDLAEQEWIIRAALATRSAAEPAQSRMAMLEGAAGPDGGIDRADLADRALAQARSIADRLDRMAYRGEGRIGWLGLDLIGETYWSVNPLRSDLYNGYPGVALFMAQIAKVTGEQRYADIARTVVAPFPGYVRDLLDPNGPTEGAGLLAGAYSGVMGMAYALDAIAVLLDDAALAEPVLPLLERMADTVDADKALDIITGAAGALAVAESIVDRYPAAAAELAARAAAGLVSKAEQQEVGIAWTGELAATKPMVGFSHGAGGIGWALLRHAHRTGDRQALRTGLAALAYEHNEFNAGISNWPDYRDMPRRPWAADRPADEIWHMHAWCHGAPGIGLARASLPAELRTADMSEDLDRAIRSTLGVGRQANHSLCHGELGNLELFAAAAAIEVPDAGRIWERSAASVVAQIERGGPLCGTPGAEPTPSLLTGLAGVGHGLLRIAAPTAIAPVLLLGTQG